MFRYSPGWLTLALLSGCSLIPITSALLRQRLQPMHKAAPC